PRIYLDGAAIMPVKSNPVIGLTIRYDRIDNFWFTLMHELAHLALHLDSESDIFYDDLDIEAEDDPREREANQLAGEVLIPYDTWEKSPASRLRSPQAAEHLAKQLNIHPAIVAGRMQHEFKAYQLLRNLVGTGKVGRLFPEVNWR
ncbi:ImmA/IrrE family metallo-endopeptidase, partial [Candidatus Bathyarchaeota archaeon]|nr:ImmA/IrrE family metallo-endopeptidase [Candidatus Bathyarchaeota archaeon]